MGVNWKKVLNKLSIRTHNPWKTTKQFKWYTENQDGRKEKI